MLKRSHIFGLLGLVALVIGLSPFLGASTLSPAHIIEPGSTAQRIFFELRLPRTLTAFFAGAALACLGGTYQALFHNPLAEPYILGISSAVTLGLAIADILFKLPLNSTMSLAFGGTAALVVATLILLLSHSGGLAKLDRVLLFGMGLQFVLSSSLFLLLSYHNQQMGGGTLRWLFGQIQWLGHKDSLIFGAVTSSFLGGLVFLGRRLDALSLGDTVARSLGVNPAKSRSGILVVTSCLVAFIVSYTGAIGFVGLVVPHAARLIFRPATSRQLFFYCVTLGGPFLVSSDVFSRALLPPYEFPVGIVTTLVGGPIFLLLLWRK